MAGLGSRDWVYVVDSSSWIAIESHPAQNRILSALVPIIESGRVKLPPQVWGELSDTFGLFGWMENYRDLLVENARSKVEYLLLGGRIAHEFPGMAGARGTREKADPWVIALAKFMDDNPNSRVVVCDETLNKRPNRKIPGACKHYQIRCLSLLEMLDQEYPADGWLE
jgi:hypothetical protein